MKNLFLHLLCPLLVCLGIPDLSAQLNYNSTGFANMRGNYTDLDTTGMLIKTASFDNANASPKQIGFSFHYNGAVFTDFVLNSNGFIKLGNTPPSAPDLYFSGGNSLKGGVFNSAQPADANILCPFNHHLVGGAGTPEFRVSTIGSGTSHVCIIQFKNMADSISTGPCQYSDISFQIQLYETTNVIEFVYGKWITTTSALSLKTAGIGLKGKDNTPNQLLVLSKPGDTLWWNIQAIDGNYLTQAFEFDNGVHSGPDPGHTFRFTPADTLDAAVTGLFTLATLPLKWGTPCSDSAVIRNVGTDTLRNLVVTLMASGTNAFSSTDTIAKLAARASVTIGFAPYSPANPGTSKITVTLPPDDNPSNNVMSCTQDVAQTLYSYAVDGPASGAAGAAGYLLTKYTLHGMATVVSANVFLPSGTPIIGQTVYAVLVNSTGLLLDSSAVYTITSSDTGRYHTFILPNSAVLNNQDFYIGLAETKSGFLCVGTQTEGPPLRCGAYYSKAFGPAPFNDLSAPSSVIHARLMIQATVSAVMGVETYTPALCTVTVAPNPAHDAFTCTLLHPSIQKAFFSLYDVNGKLLRAQSIVNAATFRIERGDLPPGLYFYRVGDGQTILGEGKLVLD